MQRTSSDLRLNPHLHVVFLDGAYREQGADLVFRALSHLGTRDVGEVLERAVRRIMKHLRKRGVLARSDDEEQEGEAQLVASAVSGQTPPAGPQWRRGLTVLPSQAFGV